MQKQTPADRLKIYSMLFYILAVIDVITLVLSFATGDMSTANLAEQTGASTSVVQASLWIVTALGAIIALVKAFLGYKGNAQANGKKTGTAHIKLAWVALVVVAIVFVTALVDTVKNAGDWISLCNQLVSVFLLGGYIKEAKAVK